MAISKGTMARASKAATKVAAEGISPTGEESTALKTEGTKQGDAPSTSKTRRGAKASAKSAAKVQSKPSAKGKAAASNVIGGASEQVHQSSSQVLDREPRPGEIFGIGDPMPVYFF